MSATGQGVRLLYGLGYAPSWANGGKDRHAPPTADHMGDWYRYCVELMRRYRGRGVVYGVWNEPNLADFFTGTFDEYTSLVRYAGDALRAVDPAARLSGPETSDLATAGREAWYTNAVKSLAGVFDVVTTHWYCGAHCGTGNQIGRTLTQYMTARAADVQAGTPVWLTETGLDSADDARQAAFYEAVLTAYAQNARNNRGAPPAWQNVFFYHLLANDNATMIWTDPGRTNRLAFTRYQSWINRQPNVPLKPTDR